MTAVEFLHLAWQTAVQTASYLFAYAFVLVLAPLAHLALLALAPVDRGWGGGEPGRRLGRLGAALAGLTRPLSRRAIETTLRQARSATAAVAFLAVSHALTASYWILLGPLLGKDFLLSHAVGVVLFAFVASVLAWAFGLKAAAGPPRERPIGAGGARLPAMLAAVALRYVLLVALGLGLGGLVAAWGLSAGARAPAELGTAGSTTQALNAALGGALALLGVPPVANLFVGTYLWKVGVAHAGIVAFFCAATAAPTRWRLYARVFGRPGAVRLVAALLIGALLAGLATAWLFGAAGVPIRYKLIPEQLWEVH